mmetsp:Transcript_43601/g.105830  ORF Transcript_43601/g.105830 Transcript_43601/m.105830 type:complete len:103 (-) Transcript_43601:603-911(-)
MALAARAEAEVAQRVAIEAEAVAQVVAMAAGVAGAMVARMAAQRVLARVVSKGVPAAAGVVASAEERMAEVVLTAGTAGQPEVAMGAREGRREEAVGQGLGR